MQSEPDVTTAASLGGPAERPAESIAVIGLGYVGLPLAVDLVRAGFRVHAVDNSPERLQRLKRGESYVDDVTVDDLVEVESTQRLRISDGSTDWTHSEIAFICVPTPVTRSREPDLRPILDAARYVARGLRGGDTVVLQSTTYPGTTMGPLRNALESATGLRAGTEFGLAFSPERTSPGDRRPARSIPRLVGGINRTTTRRVAEVLGTVAPSITLMTSPDAAEMAKLFENVFRNVNIALANELALVCERLELDVWEVIDGASTKPFGFMPFYPGPGVGGHCIPVDPYYMAARAREVGFHERFIETAGDINSRMPDHVVSLVTRALNNRGKPVRGARILLVGVAFKPGVSDDRNSPAGPIIAALLQHGADAFYHDPRLAKLAVDFGGDEQTLVMSSVDLATALSAKPDCVVIITPHPEIDIDLVVAEADLIVDTRNASRGRSVRPGQVLRLGAGWS